jgi:hypothetical protein
MRDSLARCLFGWSLGWLVSVFGWHVGLRLAGRGRVGMQEIGNGRILSHGRQVRIVECQRPVSGIQFYGPAKASMDARGVSFYGL